jgi:hypothetical protein
MNSGKGFVVFTCGCLVIRVSPTRTGKLNSRHPQSPVRVEGMLTTGCCPVSLRDRLRHCYHHLSAMQPSARCLTPWLRWTRGLFAVLGCYPSATRTPRVGFWRGAGSYAVNVPRSVLEHGVEQLWIIRSSQGFCIDLGSKTDTPAVSDIFTRKFIVLAVQIVCFLKCFIRVHSFLQ